MLLIDAQSARIGDAVVIAEGAKRRTVSIEREKMAVAVAVGTASARDNEDKCTS